MYQGQELYEKLQRIYLWMNQYNKDINEYLVMARKLRQEKQYIDTKSVKGKTNLTMAMCIIMLILFFFLLGLITQNFGNVVGIIVGIIVYFSFKNIKPLISKIALGFLVLEFLVNMVLIIQLVLSGAWGVIILVAVALTLAIVSICKILKMNRSYIDSYNKEVQLDNAPYIQRTAVLSTECQELDRKLQMEMQGWYPPDYKNLDAVFFFVQAMKNGKADTMKELVQLYDEQLRHNEIVENQRRQIELTASGIEAILDSQNNIEQQMKYNNMLGLYQVFQVYDIRKKL